MKRNKWMFSIIWLAILFWAVSFSAPTVTGDKIYIMTGTLSALNLEYNTAVIEVPLDNGQTFTVGGPLAANAILKIGGHCAMLKDFSVGEKVTVKWRSTDSGHLILALISK